MPFLCFCILQHQWCWVSPDETSLTPTPTPAPARGHEAPSNPLPFWEPTSQNFPAQTAGAAQVVLEGWAAGTGLVLFFTSAGLTSPPRAFKWLRQVACQGQPECSTSHVRKTRQAPPELRPASPANPVLPRQPCPPPPVSPRHPTHLHL